MSKNLSHVGIIMDGNRRWAKANGKSEYDGHMAGADRVESIVEAIGDAKIPYVTFYAFSQENWGRPPEEVKNLMSVFRFTLNSPVIGRFKKNNIRLNILGDYSKFPQDIIDRIERLHQETLNNTALTVNFALGYGGHDEIVRGVNKLIAKGVTEVTAEMISDSLDTAGMPDPDLLIRTGKVARTSGFLLWQSAYAELYFADILWPDFDRVELQKALDWYDPEKRRFGR